MLQYFIYAFRSGYRSRSFLVVFALGAALIATAFLASQFSPRQPQTVALDFGLSGLRFCLVLLAVFWVQEFLGKEIERKTVLFSLTYPTSRAAFLCGRYGGILALNAVAALSLALFLWLVVLMVGKGYDQEFPVALGLPYWTAVAGLWLDAAVVAAFALWVGAVSTVPMMPVALGAAFAIAGKSLGPALDYLARGADGQDQLVAAYNPVLHALQWILPDLSRLDWRAWPMYGGLAAPSEILWGTVMGLAYAAILVAFAILALRRREFI